MNFTPIDIASDITAGVLAASKLISAAQPIWQKLPRWLAVALPVVVLDIPQVVSLLGGVQSGMDLTTAIVASVALLLPGVSEAENPTATVSTK